MDERMVRRNGCTNRGPREFQVAAAAVVQAVEVNPFLDVEFGIEVCQRCVQHFGDAFLRDQFDVHARVVFDEVAPNSRQEAAFRQQRRADADDVLVAAGDGSGPLDGRIRLAYQGQGIFVERLAGRCQGDAAMAAVEQSNAQVLFQ